MKRLGDVVEILSGFAFESSRFGDSGDLPVVRIRDVVPGESDTYYRGPFDERFIIEDGDVLIGMDGEFNRARWRGGRALLNQRVCKIAPSSDELHAPYLFHFLPAALKAVERVTPFATVKHLSTKVLNDIPMLLPPRDEQERIAAILDHAERLRSKRREAQSLLDTLTESTFASTFGDPGRNPLGFPEVELGTMFDIARGGSPRPIDDYITEEPDGVNWIAISDASASAKYITATKRRIRPEGVVRSRTVKPGDFLLTNSMSFGRPYIMGTTGCIHDGWLVLSPRQAEVDPEFLYCLLGSKAVFAEFERRAAGATVKNLNIELVKAVRVPLPPYPLQKAFADRVAAIDKLKALHSTALATLDALFASIEDRAFKGELFT